MTNDKSDNKIPQYHFELLKKVLKDSKEYLFVRFQTILDIRKYLKDNGIDYGE